MEGSGNGEIAVLTEKRIEAEVAGALRVLEFDVQPTARKKRMGTEGRQWRSPIIRKGNLTR
jgi:hypothetical protein